MSTIQPRKPAGVPVGGQFDFRRGSDPSSALTPRQVAGRSESITDGRFTTPLALQPVDPRYWSSPRPWWNLHTWQQEHNHARGSYPAMPEVGLNPSGKRTYRRNYFGPRGTRVQMPSAAAIRKFAAASPTKTFDIPVDAMTTHGGVRMSVRATALADGTWHITPLGSTSDGAIAAAEAVRSVLEAQRVTSSLARTGDLLDKARARHPRGTFNINPTPSRSSFVEGVGYDSSAGAVVVQLHGRVYGYRAGAEEFAAMQTASSPGRVYNSTLKGRERVSIVKCAHCGRFSAAEGHSCEAHGPRPGR